MNYYFRWGVLGEKFPAFENTAYCYNVPALRRDTDESTPVNYELLNDKHNLL